MMRTPALGLAPLLLLAACERAPVAAPSLGLAPLGQVDREASAAQREQFRRGLAIAQRRFRPEDGLGPRFNTVAACTHCHEKPVAGGGAGHYRDFHLARIERNGLSFEAGVGGVQPHFDTTPSRSPTDAEVNHQAPRNPLPFFGSGLLAQVPENAILAWEDPADADGNGISGRANYEQGFVGRFGRKAQAAAIEGFVRGPLFNHLGLSSDPLSETQRAALPVPSESRAPALRLLQAAVGNAPTRDDDGVPDPELPNTDLFDLVSFTMLMAGPEPEASTAQTEEGSALFATLGCADCHRPSLPSPRGPVPAYSDLLVHDMGETLADRITMGEATGSEFRTQPLWGVAAAAPYLHDGRAATLDEAIRAHDGEGLAAREAYLALEPADRETVVAFLESLGGRSQRSAGLLASEATVPSTGAGAARAGTDPERFLEGRAFFDEELGFSAGLGPNFNGDACRACHFDPVIGGAGPSDVDVIRYALEGDGGLETPPSGTLLHRFTRQAGTRPEPEGPAQFERRQTPPLFGLGLVETVPLATLEALAARNGGRVSRLPDGRVGRFGWKADVASLADFTRDALFNELGLTSPPVDDELPHFGEDDDDSPDPEVDAARRDGLTHFVAQLAPPTYLADSAGLTLFNATGCGDCHTATLRSAEGEAFHPYSDFLLHDIGTGTLELEGPTASGAEFRTPPLWALAATAPYLHDGRASSIEAAIAAHAGSAEPSRAAFEALVPSDRARLLDFLRSR